MSSRMQMSIARPIIAVNPCFNEFKIYHTTLDILGNHNYIVMKSLSYILKHTSSY